MNSTIETAGRSIRVVFACLAFLVVLLLFPYVPDPSTDIKELLFVWCSFIAVSLWAAGLITGKISYRPPTILILPFSLLYALLFLSSLMSDHIGNGIQEIIKWTSLFAIYGVASQVYRTDKQLHRLLTAFTVAVALSSIYAVFQWIGLDPFPWDKTYEQYSDLPSTYGHGNVAAHALLPAIIIAVYLATVRGYRWNLLFVPLFLLHLYGTHQRGAVVGLIAATLTIAAGSYLRRRIKAPVRAVALTIIVLGMAGLASIVALMGIYAYRTGIPYPLERSLVLRYGAFSGAVEMISQKPLLGFGPGSYSMENPPYWTPFVAQEFALERNSFHSVHNEILETGVEAGLPAAGLYLTVFMIGLCHALFMAYGESDTRRRRLNYLYAALFSALLVDGFWGFNTRVPVSAVLFFLITGTMEGLLPKQSTDYRRARPRALALAACIVCVTFVAALLQSRVFAAQLHLKQGTAALALKDLPHAERAFAQGERLSPWNDQFAFLRGQTAQRAQDPGSAIVHFERCLGRNPNHVLARTFLAGSHVQESAKRLQAGTFEEALQEAESARSQATRVLNICAVLPEGHEVLGRAASIKATILSHKGDSPTAGEAKEIRMLWDEAILHFRDAIDLRAENLDEIHHLLFVAYAALDDHAIAQNAIIRAINIRPTNVALWRTFYESSKSNLKMTLFRSRLNTALRHIEAEQRPLPVTLEALSALEGTQPRTSGILNAVAILSKRAIEELQEGKDPLQESHIHWTAKILADEIEASDLRVADKASALYVLTGPFTVSGHWQVADALFEKAWEDLPDGLRHNAAIQWAQAMRGKSQYDKAIKLLEKVLASHPGDLTLSLELARTLAEGGYTARAKLEFTALLALTALNERERDTISAELAALSTRDQLE